MAKLAVLAIHGVGSTETGYSTALKKRLRREIGEARFSEIYFVEIDYQKHLHVNQAQLWARVSEGLRWTFLRRFLLFYFGDATAVLYNSSDEDSVYFKVQKTVRRAVADASEELESAECPVGSHHRTVARLSDHLELYLGRTT